MLVMSERPFVEPEINNVVDIDAAGDIAAESILVLAILCRVLQKSKRTHILTSEGFFF